MSENQKEKLMGNNGEKEREMASKRVGAEKTILEENRKGKSGV